MNRPANVSTVISPRALPVFFFLALIAAGTFAYRDYGIHTDYLWNYRLGHYSFDSYASGSGADITKAVINDESDDEFKKTHGPAFQMVLVLAERGLGIKGLRESALMRHKLTFLAFYLGVIFFYFLGHRHFRNRALALLGCLLLVLNPRIFAHAFYNDVDIPFMAFFIISMHTLIRLLDTPSAANACWHALACGFLTGIRNVGIFIPLLTLAALIARLAQGKSGPDRPGKILLILAVYAVLLTQALAWLWPYLWVSPQGIPLGTFIDSLRHSTNASWDLKVLYRGQFIAGSGLPWHYNPVWMLITIPLTCTMLFLAGFLKWLISSAARKSNPFQRNESLFALWLIVPLALPVILKSTLFDDWRHHYFIYPAFVLFAVSGFKFLWDFFARRKNLKLAVAAGIALALVFTADAAGTAAFMIRNHPHQNVYFNALAGKDLRHRFDLDYWGLSYLQGYEYLLKNDPSPVLRVATLAPSGFLNAGLIPARDRERLKYASLEEADYFLTEYRWKPDGYPGLEEFHSITVEGEKILTIYRLSNPEKPGGKT